CVVAGHRVEAEHLDRDLTVQQLITRGMNVGHPATADPLAEQISASQQGAGTDRVGADRVGSQFGGTTLTRLSPMLTSSPFPSMRRSRAARRCRRNAGNSPVVQTQTASDEADAFPRGSQP